MTAPEVPPTGSGPAASESTSVEIITIGDELLLGFTIDTNGAYLARRLAEIGIRVVRRSSVGDEPDAISAVIREALGRTGAAITTGGLGPTADDRSKAAVAAVFGRGLVIDEEHVAWMKNRWRTRFGREMPESNMAQAALPAGARKLANNHGSAPGVFIEDDRGRWVAMLPGVPREMRGMTDDTLIPLLAGRYPSDRVVRSRTLRTTGVAESLLGDRLGTLKLADDVSLAYLPSVEGVDLRLTVSGLDRATADRRLESAASTIRVLTGDAIYAEGEEDLAAVVLALCRSRRRTVAVAESCTGGLLGARLTAIPGSSDVVVGGIIAYENRVKQNDLDVPESQIAAHGAVSEPVVRAMAGGARRRFNSSIGVAITGIAGPGGGTPDKPVGTVWIAVDCEGDVSARRFNMIGDRDEVRRRSAQAALDMLRRSLC
ncbi:MAG TPA: competence/damage-inducible protein A [Gemmatimonadaceae bacterium]|nr:competence/damage-inducible protein A [Gemmatimonadaceae bacterium]